MALTVELHGCSARSPGGELVAVAAAEHLRNRFPDIRIIVPPAFGPYPARARNEFLTTWEMPTGIRTKTILRLAPVPLKQAAGIVEPREVQMVLDFGEDSFSWGQGPQSPKHLYEKMSRADRRHQVLVLMPQVFGGYIRTPARNAVRQLMDRASLVFARDANSLEAVQPHASDNKVHLAPDVSITATPHFPAGVDFPLHFSAIVPSQAAATGAGGDAYLESLAAVIASLRKRKLNPVFILHGPEEDRAVVAALAERGHDLPVYRHADPRALKAMLGRATLLIGSHYHAVASALAQGVPVAAAGPADTFEPLLGDYGCREMILPAPQNRDDFNRVVEVIGSTIHRQRLHDQIVEAGERVLRRVNNAWALVESLIADVAAGRVSGAKRTRGR